MLITILSQALLILVVLLLRRLFRQRVRASVIYALWGLVALRLLIPVPLIAAPLPSFMSAEYVQDEQQEKDVEEPAEGETKSEDNAVETEYETVTDEAVEKYLYSEGKVSELYKYEYTPKEGTDYQTDVTDGIPGTDRNEVTPEKAQSSALDAPEGGNNAGVGKLIKTVKIIWVSVAALLFFAVVVSNAIMYRRLKRSRICVDGKSRPDVYKSSLVPVPCLYGLFCPAIYITPEVSEKDRNYIICHEKMHYRHRDYIWAALRLVFVCVYWFNPFVWVAAKLSRQDAEYAADAAVIHQLGEEERVKYGESILHTLRSKQKQRGIFYLASTAGSSKKEMKKRMLLISGTKKCSAVFSILIGMAAVSITVCSFMGKAANEPAGDVPEEKFETVKEEAAGIELSKELDDAVRRAMRNGSDPEEEQNPAGDTCFTESYVPIALEETDNRATVYLLAMTAEYGVQEGLGVTDSYKEFQTIAITFEKEGDEYQDIDAWRSSADSDVETTLAGLREKFPDNVPDVSLDKARWSNFLTAKCHAQAMWQLMKQKESIGSEQKHVPIGGAEMVSIYAGNSYVGEYGLGYNDNKAFIDKLIDAYNSVRLQSLPKDSDVSMDVSGAITICYWSEWKKFVQITFDANGVCWVNGEPFTYKMKEKVFDYNEVLTFVEKQSQKQLCYHPMIADELPEIVDYETDMKLLEQCLASDNTIDGALLEKRAELLSESEGLPFETVYAAQRDMFVQMKRNRLAAKKYGVAQSRKECSLKGVRQGIEGTEDVSLNPYCKKCGITPEQYWEFMEQATMLLFPYEKCERKIFEEDVDFQREFKGQYKNFEEAAGMMEEYYKPAIDKRIQSIPVTVTLPQSTQAPLSDEEIEESKWEDAVSEAIKEDMWMTAATTSSNQYVTAKDWRFVESHVTIASEREKDRIKMYLARKAICYGIKDKKTGFEELGFRQGFCVITLKEKNGKYELSDWQEPENKKMLRAYFPDHVTDAQLNWDMYEEVLNEECANARIEMSAEITN